MWVAFALQKLLTFFSKKFQHICISLNINFNVLLTNNVVSFEQLGPGCQNYGIFSKPLTTVGQMAWNWRVTGLCPLKAKKFLDLDA